MDSIEARKQWLGKLEKKRNPLAVDVLPRWVRVAGSAVKGSLGGVWAKVSGYFARHPMIKKITVVVVVSGLVVGGSFLIQAAPGLVHTRFIQSILHSSAVNFGKDVYFWGKGLFEQAWHLAPIIGGAAAILGTIDLLFVPGKRLWSSTNLTILTLGFMTTAALGAGLIVYR